MAIYAHQTAVGVFDENDMADEAVDDLRNAGFSSGQIYYSGHAESEKHGTNFWQGVAKVFTPDKTPSHEALATQLRDLGLSEEESRYYENQYDIGHTIVAVKAPGREEEALDIMREKGAHAPAE
jgi:hypothetical protein